jgi:hypothetical protein
MTDRVPEYFVHKTEDWLIFPHELDGLSDEEITNHKSDADMLVKLRRDFE